MQIGIAQSCAEVEQAQRMFRAVLAPWASDLMALRQRGLDLPGRRYAVGLVLRPASTDHNHSFPTTHAHNKAA